MAEPESVLLTWNEAMAYLKCSRSTLRRYVETRLLKRVKPRGRVFFLKSDLDDLIKRSRM
jgi:excisionase family DNA binding protein